MSLRTAFLWSMIGSLTFAAALGIFAILFDGIGSRTEEILLTALLMGAFSTIALLCAVVHGKRRFRELMWMGIGSSAVAMFLWFVVIWVPWSYPEGYRISEVMSKTAGSFTIASLAAAHFGLLSLLRLERQAFRAMRAMTVGVTALLGFFMIAIIWTEEFEDWSAKVAGVLAILAACGTVATPVLALIEFLAGRSAPETVARRVEINLMCPRCGASQRLRAGAARCSACNLRIMIEVEEPRCACGYLLYKLESDRCPECGREVPADQRWQEPASRGASDGA